MNRDVNRNITFKSGFDPAKTMIYHDTNRFNNINNGFRCVFNKWEVDIPKSYCHFYDGAKMVSTIKTDGWCSASWLFGPGKSVSEASGGRSKMPLWKTEKWGSKLPTIGIEATPCSIPISAPILGVHKAWKLWKMFLNSAKNCEKSSKWPWLSTRFKNHFSPSQQQSLLIEGSVVQAVVILYTDRPRYAQLVAGQDKHSHLASVVSPSSSSRRVETTVSWQTLDALKK